MLCSVRYDKNQVVNSRIIQVQYQYSSTCTVYAYFFFIREIFLLTTASL